MACCVGRVGCGSGRILARLAEMFPASTFHGMDLSAEGIENGRLQTAARAVGVMQAAFEAMEGVYGKRPFFTREGGSIPVVADFKQVLGLDTVLMGFGLDSDAMLTDAGSGEVKERLRLETAEAQRNVKKSKWAMPEAMVISL